MDEEWDFSVWGEPEPDRCLSYLNMTLQSVKWQLEQDGITETRKEQMSRFIDLLRIYILSQREATDVATGGAMPYPVNSPPASLPSASVSLNARAAMPGIYAAHLWRLPVLEAPPSPPPSPPARDGRQRADGSVRTAAFTWNTSRGHLRNLTTSVTSVAPPPYRSP